MTRQSCGVLSMLGHGDLVLADKGFLIYDLMPSGVSLNVPHFLHARQFTLGEVQQTKRTASCRIQVEHAIQRIKIYKVLAKLKAHNRPLVTNLYEYTVV